MQRKPSGVSIESIVKMSVQGAVDNEANAAEIIIKYLNPDLYLRSFAKFGLRPDGRRFSDGRQISTTSGMFNSSNCYGSSVVNIGATSFMCGITVLTGSPSPKLPEHGDIGRSFYYFILALV